MTISGALAASGEFTRRILLAKPTGAADYYALRSRARQWDVGRVTVSVVGYEDLIEMKEAAGREQDLLDIHQLRDRHSAPE
jgi:hypothetical protein